MSSDIKTESKNKSTMFAYVINLARRLDKMERISSHIYSLHPAYVISQPFLRVNAVDGKELTLEQVRASYKAQGRAKEAYWRGGCACRLSHIKATEMAIEMGIVPCMILEDDCVFIEPPEVEPGMVLLGVYPVTKNGVTNYYGSHAVSYETIDDLRGWLEYLKAHKNTVDSVMNSYRKSGANVKPYSKGIIAYQEDGFSDINQEHRVLGGAERLAELKS